jgi:uroporphyrin-III C-methyltransferase
VFYMAGARLGELSRRLQAAGWPANTPVHVVSRALWPDQIASDHTLSELPAAAVLHTGRPAVVTVGVGATPVAPNPLPVERHQPPVASPEP